MKSLSVTITFFLLCLITIGQIDTIESQNLELIVLDDNWDNAKMYPKGDSIAFSGIMVDYYSGTIQVQSAVLYTDGQNKNGWVRKYYQSGNLEEEYWYGSESGMEHGKYTSWFDNGEIKMIGSYEFGDYHGTWTAYFENGNKEYERHYHNGKKIGTWTTWDEQGNVVSQEEF